MVNSVEKLPSSAGNMARTTDAVLQTKGTTLVEFLEEQHQAGEGYEDIAKELYAFTDRAINVSYQTVKRWLVDLEILEVAS